MKDKFIPKKWIGLGFGLIVSLLILGCSDDDHAINPERGIESVEIFTGQSLIKVGETIQFFVIVSPENLNETNLFWSTTNPEIAKVDQSGKVRALKSGSVYITVVSQSDLSVSDIIELNIVNQ